MDYQTDVDREIHAIQQIEFELYDLDREIEAAGGEITPEIEARMDVLASAVLHKTDALGYWIEARRAAAEHLKLKADSIVSLALKMERRTDRICDKIKEILIQSDSREKRGELHVFRLARNPGRLVIEDDTLIPMPYKITQYVPNKQAIKDDLKLGVKIPGAKIEEGVSLRMSYNTKGKQ